MKPSSGPFGLGHAIDLAVLRVAVFGTILATPDLRTAPSYAELPSVWRSVPHGLAWVAALPMHPRLALAMQTITVIACVTALLGLRTRASATIATVGLVYLFGLPQLYGFARSYHHLVWLSALLAASPSGDALSLDSLRRSAPSPSTAYGIPLRFTWALAACVFFFPGLWKLRASGLSWITSDNLILQMRWKWLQRGRLPVLRLDRWPSLCSALAAATIAFELGFPIALLRRTTRGFAVGAALIFHAATATFMFIAFPSLLCIYSAFVPWHRWLERPWRRLAGPSPTPSRSSWPSILVGGVLVAGAATAGFLGAMQAWPFACYPTFQQRPGDEMPTLELDIVDRDDHRQTLSLRPPFAGLAALDRERLWALSWSLALSPRSEGLRELVRRWGEADPRVRDARRVQVYRAMRAVDPASWADPPRSRTELAFERD